MKSQFENDTEKSLTEISEQLNELTRRKFRDTVSFWLKNKNSNIQLATIYNSNTIPYKKGDKFYFSCERLRPSKIEEYEQKYIESAVEGLKQKYEDLRKFNDEYKIINVYQAVHVDPNHKSDEEYCYTVTEYTIKKCVHINWMFWKTYKFKQFIKKYLNKSIKSL